jgi:two-component system sensor kinase FixL
VVDKDGKPELLLGTVLDITDRRMAEEEVIKQREVLARVGRTSRLGQLTGSIAHEVNQPLAGILSNSQAIELMIKKDQLENKELAEIMADIVSDTKRARDVISNLRELYQVQKTDFSPIDINAVISNTIRLLHSEFIMQHVMVTTDLSSSLPMVMGNRVQIQQVLVNLIMNGNQSMNMEAQENRQLIIASTYDANKVKVWVMDNGSGIDTTKIDQIFEPLVTWKPGGTGMGLAISNTIIESHDGDMLAENRPEGGARVGFVLPWQNENQNA